MGIQLYKAISMLRLRFTMAIESYTTTMCFKYIYRHNFVKITFISLYEREGEVNQNLLSNVALFVSLDLLSTTRHNQ